MKHLWIFPPTFRNSRVVFTAIFISRNVLFQIVTLLIAVSPIVPKRHLNLLFPSIDGAKLLQILAEVVVVLPSPVQARHMRPATKAGACASRKLESRYCLEVSNH